MRASKQKTIALAVVFLFAAGVCGCSNSETGIASSSPGQITLGSLSGQSAVSSLPESSVPASSAAPSIISPVTSSEHEATLDEFIETFIGIAEQEPQYPVKDGKTVYGELFNNPYAQWCTEFTMYCLQKAEHRLGTDFIETVYPWRDSAYRTGLWFKKENRYYAARGEFIPSRGDLIIFDSVYAGYPNHIGIVTGTVVEDGITYINTIEGNIPEDEVKQIRRRKIAATDPIIMAYCSATVTSEYTGPLEQY